MRRIILQAVDVSCCAACPHFCSLDNGLLNLCIALGEKKMSWNDATKGTLEECPFEEIGELV